MVIMSLSTRMILGWVAVVFGALALAFDYSPWFFLGGLLFADVLRHFVQPAIPRKLERRRTWILFPLAVLYLALLLLFDVQQSRTHPVHIVGGLGFAFAMMWLIWDDVRIYRLLHETQTA
jgi:hypothetical protein